MCVCHGNEKTTEHNGINNDGIEKGWVFWVLMTRCTTNCLLPAGSHGNSAMCD